MVLLENKQEIAKEIVKKTGFKHAAIIMDGNRRWAKNKHLPSAVGHKEGVSALKRTIRAADDLGIEYVTVYAFSTENWNRSPEEVNFLMDLLANTLKNELDEMHKNGVVIRFIGNTAALSKNLKKVVDNSVEKTKNNHGVKLQIAFNYGARAEILHAFKNIAAKIEAGEITADNLTEADISAALYTAGIPDPDLLIRTGGEMRVSNYLLWQIAYTEFYITEKYWPEFDKDALCDAIIEFGTRNRRWGGG